MKLLLFFYTFSYISSAVQIDLMNLEIVGDVDLRFLSLGIDSFSLAGHWARLNLRSQKVVTLTKQLGPAFLRIGGTTQDSLSFCPNRTNLDEPELGPSNNFACIYEEDVLMIRDFVKATGTELVFGLNILNRKKGHWDPENAVLLMDFMKRINLTGRWELGNEPGRLPKVFNKSVSPTQSAGDFLRLHDILAQKFQNPMLMGPDVEHIRGQSHSHRYLRRFLKRMGGSAKDVLSAITFHDYYFSGITTPVLDYVSPKIMNKLSLKIKLVRKLGKGIPIWLGETNSAYGGGQVGVSDRFLPCFMWIDKLGQCALGGVSVVVRHTLWGSTSYGLITTDEMPTPSYFVSYLFKKLVGERVLRFKRRRKALNKGLLRLYVHCGAGLDESVVFYGANLDSRPVALSLGKEMEIEEYVLTPLGSDLLSRFAALNGVPLSVNETGIVPEITPVFKLNSTINFPPFAIGFWTLRDKDKGVLLCGKN